MTRKQCPTDLTEARWERLQPLLPSPRSGPPRGGRPAADARAVVNAVLYLRRAGGAWRRLPHDSPAWPAATPGSGCGGRPASGAGRTRPCGRRCGLTPGGRPAAGGISARLTPDAGEPVLTGPAPRSAHQAVLRTVIHRDLSVAPRQGAATLDDGTGGGEPLAVATTLRGVSADDAPTPSGGAAPAPPVPSAAAPASLGRRYAPPAGMTALVCAITRLPDSARWRVLLADGTAAVVDGTYSLLLLRGRRSPRVR